MKIIIKAIPEQIKDITSCEQCPDHCCYIDSDGCADCSCGLSISVGDAWKHNHIPKNCPRLGGTK